MPDRYEVIKEDEISRPLIAILVSSGYIKKLNGTLIQKELLEAPQQPEALTDFHRFVNNGRSIETNIQTMCRDYLGTVEDYKLFKEQLKTAVKEYGHDNVLEAFYVWSTSRGTVYTGRKPITSFLRNVGSYVASLSKPIVSNSVLDRVEERIAYMTENRVFFTGDYRMKLALLLKQHEEALVIQAFGDFFQDVDDKGISWAPKNFLERAEVMINTIKKKNREAQASSQLLAETFAKAKEAIEEVEDEDEL